MSGFFGAGGTNSRQQNQSIGNLNNLFNFGLGGAKSALNTGNSALGAATSYFSKILSGNRPAMQQAVAPETNAVLSQNDAARRQQSTMGTARGGGTAGANQQQKTNMMAQIDNLLFGARPGAAKETADIGKTQVQEGTTLASTAGSAGYAEGSVATEARSQHDAEVQQSIKDIFGWG